jgi:uncharacterized membrane protein (UPF0136 family)
MAALLAVAGGAAFFRRGSVASAAASSAFAASYAFSGYLITDSREARGHTLACATGLTLGTVMGSRFLRSGRFMPAGMVASLGLASGLYHGVKANEWGWW